MPGAVVRRTLGKRSVVLALVALAAGVIAIAMLVAMPKDASQSLQTIANYFFMVVFLLAAPLAHIAGAVFGVIALVRSNDNRILGLLGVVLNLLSMTALLAILVAMASTIAAFT